MHLLYEAVTQADDCFLKLHVVFDAKEILWSYFQW